MTRKAKKTGAMGGTVLRFEVIETFERAFEIVRDDKAGEAGNRQLHFVGVAVLLLVGKREQNEIGRFG